MGRYGGMKISSISDVDLLTIVKYFRGRYTVSDRKLGSGRFGDVFLATEISTSKQVACKVVDMDLATRQHSDSQSGAATGTTLESGVLFAKEESRRFLREIRILAKLSHVSNMGRLIQALLMLSSQMSLTLRKRSAPKAQCMYSYLNLRTS